MLELAVMQPNLQDALMIVFKDVFVNLWEQLLAVLETGLKPVSILQISVFKVNTTPN
jgi:hypothetical protein